MAGFAIGDQVADAPRQADQVDVEAGVEATDVATLDETAAPTTTAAAAPPPVQGGSTRRLSARAVRGDSGGPFALPRREWVPDEDVDMEDVSEEVSAEAKRNVGPSDPAVNKRVQTMPTLPTPPVFRGATSQEKQTFMKAYEAYCRQLAALETAFFRPFRMPVGACVEDERRRLIAMFDICKPLDSITESDWINYFWEGRISGELDFEKVKTMMSSKLRMDTRLADANSRVSKLAHEMYQLLEKENMEWMIEGESKKVVHYMIDALAPEQFQKTVRNEMAREANKPLLKNVVSFITWLRTSCKEYMRWEPPAARRSPAEPSGKQGPRRTETTVASQNRTRPTSGAQVTRSGRLCLKCSSDTHRVKECPQAKPGEAEALLREWREKNPRKGGTSQQPKVPTPVHPIKTLQLSEVPLDGGSNCVARIENTVDLANVLLDSGADVNVVSRGLITLLREQGVAVRTKEQEPHKLTTFDGAVFEVTQMVHLDVIQIQTTAGPLLLRRTPAWVFEQEASKPILILSRPVMERLGYSVDAILARACDTQPEWDLQDLAGAEDKPLQDIHLIRDAGLRGPDPELRAATPGPIPADPEELISRILRERGLEASSAGLAADQVARLEELLFEYRDVFRVSFVVSGDGVKHCPSRIEGLVSMPDPTNAGQLQQFMCAVNWMRQNIASYSELAAPLLEVVDAAAKQVGSRKTKQLCRVLLKDLGWDQRHMDSLNAIRSALVAMVPLAHPDPSKAVALFTDASQDFWSAVCTQVEESELEKPVDKQNHRPLAFLSGRFTGAQLRWPTIEKEAYAIIEAVKRLEYLLLRPGGFHLFTDHRNLVYMFNPGASDSSMQRYQADKLQRWAMAMTSYRYVIEHIRGEDNVWADMLSRWGNAHAQRQDSTPRVQQIVVVPPLSPLEDEEFEWPTLDEIRNAQQQQHTRPEGVVWNEERACFVVDGDRVWIPTTGCDIAQRICVVAHAGRSGHRGERTTAAAVAAWCWWPRLVDEVTQFVRSCIHCVATRDGREPRPYGAAIHATKPNEVLHFDYLTLPEDEDSKNKYVLVVKDDFSGFVELYPAAEPDARTCATSLLQWFYRYGVVWQWVSDQGTHFKNQVIQELASRLGANHHFTTAYCPWANGTVEVVNRLLLKCIRAVLSEQRLSPSKWEAVLGMVQAALNQQPSDKLGGRAPVTAFMGLPATTPLSAIFASDGIVDMDEETLHAKVQEHLVETAKALEMMHRDVSTISDRRRLQARARRAAKAKPPNFSVGDFVLTASVLSMPNKLAIKWQGPKRVVQSLTEWVFEVEDLNPPHNRTKHHVSRLRFYAESSRDVTEDLLQHALHSQGGHCVEAFCGIRCNAVTKQWELEVKWLGLDALENTWETGEISPLRLQMAAWVKGVAAVQAPRHRTAAVAAVS
ncbi:unnamed protein product [Phytophthora fragariaefolia]|uniref:Unnamed protein product n=1 Tax=Phytophthora fragariaefolia TaxID=1490495 RepID=A0A9W6YLU7_9STRA|nr:unnamed protein product [Phytophthora fragariaefolia]